MQQGPETKIPATRQPGLGGGGGSSSPSRFCSAPSLAPDRRRCGAFQPILDPLAAVSTESLEARAVSGRESVEGVVHTAPSAPLPLLLLRVPPGWLLPSIPSSSSSPLAGYLTQVRTLLRSAVAGGHYDFPFPVPGPHLIHHPPPSPPSSSLPPVILLLESILSVPCVWSAVPSWGLVHQIHPPIHSLRQSPPSVLTPALKIIASPQ